MSPGKGAKLPLAENYWYREKIDLASEKGFVFAPPLTCCMTKNLFQNGSEPGLVHQACADANTNLTGLSTWVSLTIHERRLVPSRCSVRSRGYNWLTKAGTALVLHLQKGSHES